MNLLLLLSFASVRQWLELGYFIAQIALAFIAGIGLYQVAFAKESLIAARRNIQRQSIVLAADCCKEFAVTLHPELFRLRTELIKLQLPMVAWKMKDSKFTPESLILQAEAEEWAKKMQTVPDSLVRLSHISNILEAFAIYFTHGAADEHLAVLSVGPVIFAYVEEIAPYLIGLRAGRWGIPAGQFDNLVQLYSDWGSQVKERRLLDEKRRADANYAGHKAHHNPPIGSEDPSPMLNRGLRRRRGRKQ